MSRGRSPQWSAAPSAGAVGGSSTASRRSPEPSGSLRAGTHHAAPAQVAERALNVALVGYGSIAREHALAIRTLQAAPAGHDLRLYGVAGRVREPTEAFAREFGMVRATTDLDELLADPAVAAVVICSPTDLHADQTERALNAGKHVLCEIPLATSLAAADRLIALADGVDRRLMVCHTQRYHPALIEARRIVESGELRPHAVVGRYVFRRHENVNWKGRRRSWTDNLLWHHGCHAVDTALWLLDATEADVAARIAPPGGPLGIPMELGIVLRTPSGQIATVALSYNSHLAINDYLLIGEETTVLVAGDRLVGPDGVVVEAPGGLTSADAIERQDAEFFDAVREGRDPAVAGRAVRPALAVLQAAQDALDARLGLGATERAR